MSALISGMADLWSIVWCFSYHMPATFLTFRDIELTIGTNQTFSSATVD
jgi:hypothetical protein